MSRRSLLLPPKQRILTLGQVHDVGQVGNFRSGRALTNADFTACGLSTPRALWNLSDNSDASGNGVALTNGGSTSPTAAIGITGEAATAKFFSGQGATAPFLSAPNTIKQGYGTWGCWFKTAKRGVAQSLIVMFRTAGVLAVGLDILSTNVMRSFVSSDGSSTAFYQLDGSLDVCDDRWHFAQFSWDGSKMVLLLDGRIEAVGTNNIGAPAAVAPAYTADGTMLLYIGSRQADNVAPFFGMIDEAFVTSDIVDLDQHRFLMAKKVDHGQPPLVATSIRVDRRRRTSNYVAGDFPTQPLVGYNLNTAALTTDNYGSLSKALTNNGGVTEAPDVDGARTGAANFQAASSQSLSATDASLPSGTGARSVGVWFKLRDVTTSRFLIGWGTTQGTNEVSLGITTGGLLSAQNGALTLLGPAVSDGQWHLAVFTQDGAASDGLLNKLFLDGRLVASSTAALVSVALGGANKFRLGSTVTPDNFLLGQIGGAFVCGYALTSDQVRTLYNKQGISVGNRSPVDPIAALIERYDDSSFYLITPPEIPGTDTIELEVDR